MNVQHQKIELPGRCRGLRVYADHFRYGDPERDRGPALVYIGGAITDGVYEARRTTRPRRIEEELTPAMAAVGVEALDVAVVPLPPWVMLPDERDEIIAEVRRVVLVGILPACGVAASAPVGVVGYSAGGMFAVHLAARSPRVRAVATLAGVGLLHAVMGGPPAALSGKPFFAFANDEDLAAGETAELAGFAPELGLSFEMSWREGDHPFDDYAANGAVTDAFRAVLGVLQGGGSG